MKNKRVILGLDPGTRNTGWAKVVINTKGEVESVTHGTFVQKAKGMNQLTKIRAQTGDVVSKILEYPVANEVWIEAFFPFRWVKSSTYQLMLNGGLMTIFTTLKKMKVKIKGETRSIPPRVWKDWIRETKYTGTDGRYDSVEIAVRAISKMSNVLDYEVPKGIPQHEIDALGVAIFGYTKGLNAYQEGGM